MMENIEVGDAVISAYSSFNKTYEEMYIIHKIRIDGNNTKLWQWNGEDDDFREWNQDGKLWNSSCGKTEQIVKIVIKDKNPEYFL